MFRMVVASLSLALASLRCSAMSNVVSFLTYNYSNGHSITNESLKVWFYRGSAWSEIIRSEDVGRRTRMVETICRVGANAEEPIDVCMQIAELAEAQRARESVQKGRVFIAVEALTSVKGKDYYCAITRDELVGEKENRLYIEMQRLCSAMTTNVAYSMSKREYYIDKIDAPATMVDVSTVVSNPQYYVGKNVELVGYYLKYKEGGAVFAVPPSFKDSEPALDYPYKGVWVGPIHKKNVAETINQCGFGPVHVRVLGMIFADFHEEESLGGKLDPFVQTGFSAGPSGQWPLEIIDIRNVTILDSGIGVVIRH